MRQAIFLLRTLRRSLILGGFPSSVPEFRLAFPYPDAAVVELPRWQQPDSRTRNALIRSLRGLGERGFALLTQRWTTLQNVTASPSRIGDIAKAALVLVQFEHKMIELHDLILHSRPANQCRCLSSAKFRELAAVEA